ALGGLLALALDSCQGQPIRTPGVLPVDSDDLRDGPVIEVADALEQRADRVLVPGLRVGVSLDPIVMAVAVTRAVPADERGQAVGRERGQRDARWRWWHH